MMASMMVLRLAAIIFAALCLFGQTRSTPPRPRQMRPIVRGTHAAVSSMKPEATLAAQRIHAGGNAFDAAVAGQAVLALTDAANNGIGSDAMLLVYDARAGTAAGILIDPETNVLSAGANPLCDACAVAW